MGNGREIQARTKLALEREGKALNTLGVGGWVVVTRKREGFRPVPGGSKNQGTGCLLGKWEADNSFGSQITERPFSNFYINKEGMKIHLMW